MAGSVDNGLVAFYTTQFSTNLELLLQQMGSKLRGRVREGAHVGKQASPVNQVGAITLKSPAGRFAPLNRTDTELYRRWVFPQEGEIAQLIDSFDELQTIVDPKSEYAENAKNAVGRAWDDAIIVAATGNASLGQDAGSLSTETFSTSSFQISVSFGASAAAGLTVAKMIEARRILRHYHNDLEVDPPTMVIGSQQESDLLNQVQVVSDEFNDRPVLVDGRITRFLGFDIVYSERLPDNAGAANQRGVLAFVKSGMYLGIWKEMQNRVTLRDDLSSQPWQLYTQVMFGATRLQPGKVLQILCSDSSGSDITP